MLDLWIWMSLNKALFDFYILGSTAISPPSRMDLHKLVLSCVLQEKSRWRRRIQQQVVRNVCTHTYFSKPQKNSHLAHLHQNTLSYVCLAEVVLFCFQALYILLFFICTLFRVLIVGDFSAGKPSRTETGFSRKDQWNYSILDSFFRPSSLNFKSCIGLWIMLSGLEFHKFIFEKVHTI